MMTSMDTLTWEEIKTVDESLYNAHKKKNIKEIIEQCSDPIYALHNSVYWASYMGNIEYLNEAFSSRKINVSWMNRLHCGRSFLHACIQYGRTDVCRFLISIGVNIDQVDENGYTPLHRAANYGYDAVVKALIEGGAKLDIKNKDGDTPIDVAKSNRTQNCVDILQTAMSRQQEHTKVKPSENISSEVQDDTPILNKSPDSSHIMYFIKCHSARWNEFGSELQVPHNKRESLKQDKALSDNDRLEEVVIFWIQSECSGVTWEKILKTLNSMHLKKTADIVQDCLTRQQVFKKSQMESTSKCDQKDTLSKKPEAGVEVPFFAVEQSTHGLIDDDNTSAGVRERYKSS